MAPLTFLGPTCEALDNSESALWSTSQRNVNAGIISTHPGFNCPSGRVFTVAGDDNWRKDELKCVCVCVCARTCQKQRRREKQRQRKERGKDLLKLWEFLNTRIIFFEGVLFLTQNFIVCL